MILLQKAKAVSPQCQYLARGRESGRGQPQSKTLRDFRGIEARGSVLECGCLLPLSP
jgi:hypothetical protein